MQHPQSGTISDSTDPSPLGLSPKVAGVVLALLLVSAFAIRLPYLSRSPYEFHTGRQFHAALLARNYELGGGVSSADADQRMAALDRAPLVEPPLVELAVAGVWRITGSEPLWVGGLVSVLAWMLGGWWMYALGRRLVSRLAGLVAAALFVWTPVGIAASRAFMPDPLMVAAIVGATLRLVIDDEQLDRRSFALAAGSGAFALFVKSVAGFFVVPVLVGLTVSREGWRGLVSRRAIGLAALIVAPALAWQVYGTWIQHFLAVQSDGRILPDLLIGSTFWSNWWSLATEVTGYAPLLVAAVGLVLARGRVRWVIGALFAGYVVFGLLFDYHYSTHIYYHLPLLVPVGLGVGAAVDAGVRRAQATRSARDLTVVALTAMLLLLSIVHWQVSLVDYGPGADVIAQQEQIAVAVGDATGHSDRVIMLAGADGDLLRFYGRVAGPVWPEEFDLAAEHLQGHQPQTVEDRFDQTSEMLGGARFFAVTAKDQLAAQPDLQPFLDGRYRRIADCGGTCVVWDLTSAKTGG